MALALRDRIGRDGNCAQGIDVHRCVGDGTALVRVVGEHDLVETDLGTARIDQNDNSVVFGGSVDINDRGDLAFNAALTPPSSALAGSRPGGATPTSPNACSISRRSPTPE